MAQETTRASMKFQMSRRYAPGCATRPKSKICNEKNDDDVICQISH